MAEDLTKKLYVQASADFKSILSRKRFSDKILDVQVVEHGIVLPIRAINGAYKGGVCDSDFNFVAGSSRKPNNGGGWASVISAYTVDKSELVQLDEDVIFGGSLIGHFGHFMLECWNRLWYVIQNPDLKCKILFTITCWGHHAWFDEFFRLMGIERDRIIYVDKPTQCRSITVPEQSQYNPYSFTKEFFVPYQAIKSRLTPSAPKKIYLTRGSYEDEGKTNFYCCNEKYFEDFFAKHGFEIVSIETLSLEQQISLIMGADEIAAIMGTLTHWAMFCKPTAKFIALLRTHDLLMNQAFVFSAANIDQYFVDVSKNFLYADSHVGVCMIGSNKYWKEFVADYFDEDISKDDDDLYFEEALDKYVNLWYKKYARYDKIISSSLKNVCNHILMLEKEINNNRPLLTYQTHVAEKSWGFWLNENQLSNSFDELDIQAIKIKFSKPFHDVFYSVYYNETEGWSQEVSNGAMAGTTGKHKSIFGIKIRLDDSGGGAFDILYRAHTFDGEWTPWAQNGAELLSNGVKLNALQIKLVSK